MSTEAPVKKKRGRKPKNYIKSLNKQPIKDFNSEEEPLITHLKISSKDSDIIDTSKDDDIFFKPDGYIKNLNKENKKNQEIKIEKEEINNLTEEDNEEIKLILNKINDLTKQLENLSINKKFKITKTKYNKNTKCWWCKNCFENDSVVLPHTHINNTFVCFGNFCSYNCALAYNFDLNDENIWRRKSLLYLLYFKTYNKMVDIKPALDWKMLEEYGGTLTLNELRMGSIVNDIDYYLLKPPIETRYSTIEIIRNKSINNTNELKYKRLNPKKNEKNLINSGFIKYKS